MMYPVPQAEAGEQVKREDSAVQVCMEYVTAGLMTEDVYLCSRSL